MAKPFLVSCCLVLSFACLAAQAQQTDPGPGIAQAASGTNNSSRTISFSGTVAGQPDGALPVNFFIYADQQSTTALWSETQTVQVTGGRYSALLGAESAKGIPPELFSADTAHWLGVEVNGKEQRFLLVSVPFAMRAIDAERLGGLLPSEFVTAQQLQTILQNAAAPPAKQPPATSLGAGMNTAGTGPRPLAATAGTPPQPATDFTDNNTSEVLLVTQQGTGFAIHAISGGDAAVFGENSSTTGTAIRGSATATTGATTGVLGQAASPSGAAGAFESTGGAKILSLRANGIEVGSVDQSGNLNVTANVLAQNFVGNGFGLLNIPAVAIGATPNSIPNSVVARDSFGGFSAGQIIAQNFVGSGFGLSNIPASAVGATSNSIPNSVVARDSFGGFSAEQILAQNFVGNGFGLSNIPNFATTATDQNIAGAIVARDIFGSFSAGQVLAQNFIGNGFGLSNIPNNATTAQTGNTPNAIVARDAFGGFAAGTIQAGDLRTNQSLTSSGYVDFSAATTTIPIKAVNSISTPLTCVMNRELLIKQDATPGQQLFICNSTGDGWLLLGDGTAAGVTSVSAGDSSISIGGTGFAPTISVANGGITSAKLSANAAAGNIADGSLTPAKIAGTAAILGSNTFTASQTVQGSLTATNTLSATSLSAANGAVSGNSSGNLFSITQNGLGAGLSVTVNGTSFSPSINVIASQNGDAIDARNTFGNAVFGISSNGTGVQGNGLTGVGAVGQVTGLNVQSTATNGTAVLMGAATGGKFLSGNSGPNGFTETFNVDATGNILAAGALSVGYPNNTVFGTFVNGLARLDIAGAVERTFPTDTSGIVGVVIGGAGFSGSAQVAYSGVANCLFDNASTVDHYVVNSSTTPGFCSDAGISYPSSGQIIGRVLKSAAAGVATPIFLLGPEVHGFAGGTISSINTGAGLAGGPITSSGTISIASAGVTNAMLQNSSVTVTPGSGLSGGGTVPLGGSVTLSNTGTLSFNGRAGNVVSAPGDYSFSQIAGAAGASQLPTAVVYNNQANTFTGDQTINGTVNATSAVLGSASISGNSLPLAGVITVNDASDSGGLGAILATSRNNPAAVLISSGPSILFAGTPAGALLTLNNQGALNVTGTVSSAAFSGDGSAVTNVNAARIGGLAATDLATSTSLTTETSARQAADTTLQNNINAEAATRLSSDSTLQASINSETSARQSDVANLQTSINNVSAADAKLAASNTFTAGTQDFSGAGATLPVKAVTIALAPATCAAGKELLIETDAPAGQQLFICNAAGTGWNLVGDGAAGGVTSFNGRSGSVVPANGDYSFSQVSGSVASAQMPALSGDVTSSAGSTVTTLAVSGVTAGTYTKLTVDAKGRATSGTQAAFTDLSGSATTAQLPATVVYNNQANTFAGNQTVTGTLTATSFSGSGTGLTGVNAASLNDLGAGSFAQLATANAFAGKQTLAASTTSAASLNVPGGVAPTTPAAGDVWNTGNVLQYRDSASTTRSLVSTTQASGMQLLKLTASITPSSVSVASCSEQSFPVSGISTTDLILTVAQPSTTSPGTNIAIGGWRISAANTVAIQFCNVNRNNSSTPAGGVYTIAIMR